MSIAPDYWLYSAVQTMLSLVLLMAAAFYSYWYWETRINKPPLRWLLLLSAAMNIAVAQTALKWIFVRAIEPDYAIRMIVAVQESGRGYWEYIISQALVLAVAALQLVPIWTVRKHSIAWLIAILATLGSVSLIAVGFHSHQLESLCAPVCRR